MESCEISTIPGPAVKSPKERSILVVEDEEPIRQLIEMVLNRAGYEVRSESNGASALRLLESGEIFDLVITDITLPEMNGRDLAAWIHEIDPSVKILFESGSLGQLPMGAFDGIEKEHFLQKPFTPKELLSTVDLILRNNLFETN